MYEAWFGLSNLPFRIAPDSRFYVEAAPHRAAVEALLARLGRGVGFVPVVGEFGAGKTTVARRMLDRLDCTRHVVGELSRPRFEGDDLFDRVGAALGRSGASGHASLEGIAHEFEDLVRRDIDAVLLVDDAHQLEVDALQRLHRLTAVRVGERAALRVVLVGRTLPRGVEALRLAGQALDIGTPIRVDPLDADETRRYVLERLQRAGWSGRPAFDAATTAAIHARCRGNPGRINRLCGRILLQLYLQRRHDLDAADVRWVDDLLQGELTGGGTAPPALAPVSAGVPSQLPAAAVVPPRRTAASTSIATLAAVRDGSSPARWRVPGAAALAVLLGAWGAWQGWPEIAKALPPSQRLATAPVPRLAMAMTSEDVAATAPPDIRPAPTRDSSNPVPGSATLIPDPLATRAVRALAESPPGAGADAAPAAPEHAHHASRDRRGARRRVPSADGPPADALRDEPAPATCTVEAQALGLCAGSRARAPVRVVTSTPMPAGPSDLVRSSSPGPRCDQARAVLGLCTATPSTTP